MTDRKEYLRQYREKNKEKIKQHHQKKYYCELTKKYINVYGKKKHEQTVEYLEAKAKTQELTPQEKEWLKKGYNKVIGGLLKKVKEQEALINKVM